MTESQDEDAREAISLAPLTPEEALRALLAVDPEDEPVEDDSEDQKAPPQEGRGATGRSNERSQPS